MKILIIIPAHNEEKYILSCLRSLELQTFQDIKVMVVNDGSTDATEDVLEEFKHYTTLNTFSVFHRSSSQHEPGAKVVNAFNYGLKLKRRIFNSVDIICKIDADIVFPVNYFEWLSKMFEHYPKLGMTSGLVRINKKPEVEEGFIEFKNKEGQWVYEDIASKNHVRGPIKAYRKECFVDMNGLRPVLGWDNIDVMLAKMHGWEVLTNKKMWVKHLRPTAQKYKEEKAKKQGEYFYNIGLDKNLAMLSALKSSWKSRSVKQFFQTMKSYKSQHHKRVLTPQEIEFIRQLRWREIRQKFKLI